MTDKEQEWIEKFRAAIETQPTKKSKWRAMRPDLRSLRNIVNSIMNLGERVKTQLSMGTAGQAPELAPTQAPVIAPELRQGSLGRSGKTIAVERPAFPAQQRRRAS